MNHSHMLPAGAPLSVKFTGLITVQVADLRAGRKAYLHGMPVVRVLGLGRQAHLGADPSSFRWLSPTTGA